MFNIPICLFIFKRPDKAAKIIDRISRIEPKKIYLIGDGPRNDDEKEDVLNCREIVESHITWPCEIIRDYADSNRGVYDNIAGGAIRVFHKEGTAIFLEDDNMPATSFFRFCEEMLSKYEDDEQILWIMGSNYLKTCEFDDGSSYTFTQNMLPCGWASWAKKFLKYYDGEFTKWRDGTAFEMIKKLDYRKALKNQEIRSWNYEIHRKTATGKYASWDYQMRFSLRSQNLYGIIPKYNQITNIGVDELSIHGGNSMANVMTRRFCENETKELEFPLVHPQVKQLNPEFERKLGNIILVPFSLRLRGYITRLIKSIFGISQFDSLRTKLHL